MSAAALALILVLFAPVVARGDVVVRTERCRVVVTYRIEILG